MHHINICINVFITTMYFWAVTSSLGIILGLGEFKSDRCSPNFHMCCFQVQQKKRWLIIKEKNQIYQNLLVLSKKMQTRMYVGNNYFTLLKKCENETIYCFKFNFNSLFVFKSDFLINTGTTPSCCSVLALRPCCYQIIQPEKDLQCYMLYYTLFHVILVQRLQDTCTFFKGICLHPVK